MSIRTTLLAFLTTARNALKAPAAQRPKPLTLVVGNESADLDSLCSAIVYAFIRTHTAPHTLHIPLSNLPREDLALRTEMTAVLRHAGLVPENLLTLSDLPDGLEPHDTRWLLVDHNSLTGPLRRFAGQVTGCVDHHVDEGVIPRDAQPRVIEPCGSCMSLLVHECKQAWTDLSRQQTDDAENDGLIKLALAPILLDTTNLTAKSKVRPKDTQAVSFLEQQMRDKAFNATKYYDEINAVKEDISGLSFRDIFRKDYKQWEEQGLTLGVCCVVQGFEYLLEKAQTDQQDFLQELASWSDERKLDVSAVMTTSHPGGKFHRQLLVWGRNDKGTDAVGRFKDLATERLRLEQWKNGELDGDGNARFAWGQYELAASRKQVAPLLREALKLSKEQKI
ncbi:Exopolyphosphatase [Conoideocrella luteorostrata]|uniref:Exopolyphosphatase n=1 Tax=Conoideocrella luteorostrata TaxID=1105319 RepID=A0AAJ0CKJ8_9HYPO|nr:Exopolyphosphatase [Conoideocrella luteorostrata]